MVEESSPCPACGQPVERDPGYTPWCAACGWNVEPIIPDRDPGRLDRLYQRVGRWAGARLHGELLASRDLRPRPSVGFIVAAILSIGITVLLVASVLVGVQLILSGNLFAILVGAILLLAAFASRPRRNVIPDDGRVSRDEAPALWGVFDRIADALGTRPPDVLIVDGGWNAAVGVAGLPRRRFAIVGLPLFAALSPEERVAVVGHEVGHWVNGDPARSGIVWYAIGVLVAWSTVLDPEELAPSDEGIVGILAIPLTLTMRALSWLLLYGASGLLLLVFRDQQRGEYYADRLAAQLAGRDAAIRALETLGNDKPYTIGVQGLGIASEGRDLISSLRAAIAATPPREHQRLRRAEKLEGSRLDSTHPPTAFRMEMLRAGEPHPPQLVLQATVSEALDAELAGLAPRIQANLADEARARLYA